MKPPKATSSLLLTFICLYSQADTVKLPCMRTPLNEENLHSNLWDLGECNLIAEDVKAWVSVSPTGFVTEYYGSDATHYLVRGDSLFFRGYTRGNNIAAIADSMYYNFKMPPGSGDGSSSRYSLDGYFSGRRTFSETGICKTTVMGEGDLVFAPGDTLRAVLVHEVHTNISDNTAVGEGAEFRDEYWRWYTPGSILPVAVQTASFGSELDKLLTINYDDYIFENIKDTPGRRPDTDKIVSDAIVYVSGDHVDVSLAGCGGLAAEISIVDPQGNIYGHADEVEKADELTLSIETRGIPHGFYMMVISVYDPGSGSEPSTEKRMISI